MSIYYLPKTKKKMNVYNDGPDLIVLVLVEHVVIHLTKDLF